MISSTTCDTFPVGLKVVVSLPAIVSRFELLLRGILLPLLHFPYCFCMVSLGSGGGDAAAASNVRGPVFRRLWAPDDPRLPAPYSSLSAQYPGPSAADSSLLVYTRRIRVHRRRIRVYQRRARVCRRRTRVEVRGGQAPSRVSCLVLEP